MINIRPFSGCDIDEIVEIWNSAMPDDKITKHLFIKNFLLDHNFDKNGFMIAEKDGEIVGFVYALVRVFPADKGATATEDIGYINAIAIKYEDDVLGGLGQELVRAAEEYVRSFGKSKINVAKYTPHYLYQGINVKYKNYVALFDACGYTNLGNSYSRAIDLETFEIPEDVKEKKAQREKEGFIFTDMKDEYILSLFEYASPGWNHRFRRLLLETMDYEKFTLVVYEEKVIGVAIFGDTYSCEERFGPYSVSEEFRGLGLGKILLCECFSKMKARGLKKAWSQSTPPLGAANGVYNKIGFKPIREYFVFEKQL